MRRQLSDAGIIALKNWLGPKGVEWFTEVGRKHGTVAVVLTYPMYSYPHAVHFHEGMQVRNFMRTLDECTTWDAHDFDDSWVDAVETAVTEK